MMIFRNFLLIVVLLALVACSWVKLSPAGEKVRVLSMSDVSSCKKLGKTQVSVTDKVVGLERKEHIIQENLNILARNSGADMGGDTVVPVAPEKGGKQEFNVYRCIGP